MSRSLRLVLSCVLLCGSLTPVPAQELPSLSETIDVSIVNLEVFVTDRKGHRVQGLTRDDFEIYENGTLQPISNFSEYVAGVSAEGDHSTPTAKETRQKRTVIVFIDRFSMPARRTGPLFTALRKLLRETIAAGDAVTIVSWNRVLVLRLPFTDDVVAVDRVLDTIEKESSLVARNFQPTIELEREWLETVAAPATAQGFAIDPIAAMPLSGLEAATHAQQVMRNKIGAINGLIRSISSFEGRKALVLVTHRFSQIAGREFLVPRGSLATGKSLTEFLFDMQNEMRGMVKTANANGVTIYPLYPEGLGSENDISAEMRSSAAGSGRPYILLDNELQAMTTVARGTGGLAEWGSENIVQMLPRVKEDFDAYYSMAYRIASSGTDRGRAVVVKAKNRDYVVRARREYVEKSDKTRMSDRVLATLVRGVQGSTIDLRIRVGTIQQLAKRRYLIPVTVRIPVRSVMTLPQLREHAGAFSVFVGWGNALGELGPVSEQRQTFHIEPEEYDGVQLTFHTYTVEVIADDLTDRVAVGVFDEVSKDYGLARIELPPRPQMKVAQKGRRNGNDNRDSVDH